MSGTFTLFFHVSTLILLFLQQSFAEDTSISDALKAPYSGEVKCYALPYGAFGFASHILTYYAIIMVCLNRRPMAPWVKMKGGAWNRGLAIIKLIFTIIPSLVTMVRCSHSWQFEAMAGMKLALSLTSGLISLHPTPFYGLLYLPGVLAGTAGTISLAASNFNHNIRIITGVFGGLALACSILAVTIECCRYVERDSGLSTELRALIVGIGVFLPFLLIFGALYSDWVLAVVENNLVGYPYGSNRGIQALWVFYMIGKRLNLFMI